MPGPEKRVQKVAGQLHGEHTQEGSRDPQEHVPNLEQAGAGRGQLRRQGHEDRGLGGLGEAEEGWETAGGSFTELEHEPQGQGRGHGVRKPRH